jgi:hypothetical protein
MASVPTHLASEEEELLHFMVDRKPRAKRGLGARCNLFFFLFICANNVWVFSPLFLLPPPLPHLTPRYQAETILPLFLILLKREYKQ